MATSVSKPLHRPRSIVQKVTKGKSSRFMASNFMRVFPLIALAVFVVYQVNSCFSGLGAPARRKAVAATSASLGATSTALYRPVVIVGVTVLPTRRPVVIPNIVPTSVITSSLRFATPGARRVVATVTVTSASRFRPLVVPTGICVSPGRCVWVTPNP